jgi:DNA-binding CsgD family transcriptional regulator
MSITNLDKLINALVSSTFNMSGEIDLFHSIENEFVKTVKNRFSSAEYYYFIYNVNEFRFEWIDSSFFSVFGDFKLPIKFDLFNEKVLINNSLPEDFEKKKLLQFNSSLEEGYTLILQEFLDDNNLDLELRNKYKIGRWTNLNMLGAADFSSIKSDGIELGHQRLSLHIVKLLSPREIEIVNYLLKGFSSNEIATRLFLSKSTIDTHRRNILRKLKLKTTKQLQALIQ